MFAICAAVLTNPVPEVRPNLSQCSPVFVWLVLSAVGDSFCEASSFAMGFLMLCQMLSCFSVCACFSVLVCSVLVALFLHLLRGSCGDELIYSHDGLLIQS